MREYGCSVKEIPQLAVSPFPVMALKCKAGGANALNFNIESANGRISRKRASSIGIH